MFNKYYCIKQHDQKDCGIACLVTIAKQYKLKTSIAKVREIAGTTLYGTSALGIIKAANHIGFTAKIVRISNKEDIFKKFPKPAIAHVIKENVQHFIVIHRVTKKKLIIADPSKGIVKYTPEEFFKIWTDVLIVMIPSSNFETSSEVKGIFRRFIQLIKIQRTILFNMFISSILVTILGIVGTFYFKFLIDDILPSYSDNGLIVISIAMIILVIFKTISEFFRSLLLLHMSQNIDIPLLFGYFNHIIDLPMNFFSTRRVGEIISRFNDAAKIREAISSAILTIMIDIIMSILGGVILFNQSHRMFFFCFIPILMYLIIVICFKRPIDYVNRNLMEDNSKLTSYLVEAIEGIETIKAFNGEEKVNLETEKRFIKFIKSMFKYGYVNNLQSFLKSGIKGTFGILILWIGGYFTLKGDITIGTLISFNALLIYFIEPIERVINLQPKIQSAVIAAERLCEILDLEKEKLNDEDEKIFPETLLGDIYFKNVNFRYGTKKLVLENLNIKIKAKEKVALVGESGSGKTTVSKLLMNYYMPEKGEIILNSYNIKDINKEALREKIAYISQESFFFFGTIKDNLKFANKDLEYDEMIDVCQNVHIHDFISSLPKRYNTLIEEKGGNLSGGQRQRLAIARALLKKPQILIMDEATSNLDSITEKAIQKTIENYTKDITTIIIAHRLSTIIKCDKIIVMKTGKVVEYGTHEELLIRKGYYYELLTEQGLEELSKDIIKKNKNNNNNIGGIS